MSYELAQVNIGRLAAPLDSPQLAAFMAALDPVNAAAEQAPGYIWRLQTEDGNATALRPYDDDLMIVNMSTWASFEALAGFVYGEEHRAVMVQRRKWFERMEVYMVLWWVPAGHVPSVDEAKVRLALLYEHGPTSDAFTFRHRFPAPDGADLDPVDDDWTCSV